MKRLLPVALLVLLSLLLLTQVGCDSDEETSGVDGPCGITITSPLPGEVFLSEEEVKILWSRSGSASTVKIDLLKSGVLVGEIITQEENDGYYFWPASNMDESNGSDFSIRVAALGETDCFDESSEFSMTNVSGCNFDFITPPANPVDPDEGYVPLTLTADGSAYEITWFSSFTSGLVDIELIHVSDVVGLIASDVLDSNQSYLWDVDSMHDGTGSQYKIKITDTRVSSCNQISPYFDMVDEDICTILVGSPVSAQQLHLGEDFDILWGSQQVDGDLNIYLYYNSVRIDTIAENVDSGETSYRWNVFVPGGLPDPNKELYQIRVEDNNNLYAPCLGTSGIFLITN